MMPRSPPNGCVLIVRKEARVVTDPVRLGLLPDAPQRSWQEVSWPWTQYSLFPGPSAFAGSSLSS